MKQSAFGSFSLLIPFFISAIVWSRGRFHGDTRNFGDCANFDIAWVISRNKENELVRYHLLRSSSNIKTLEVDNKLLMDISRSRIEYWIMLNLICLIMKHKLTRSKSNFVQLCSKLHEVSEKLLNKQKLWNCNNLQLLSGLFWFHVNDCLSSIDERSSASAEQLFIERSLLN